MGSYLVQHGALGITRTASDMDCDRVKRHGYKTNDYGFLYLGKDSPGM